MKVLLGVTGSVAAKLTYKLVCQLQQAGHEIKIVGTENCKHFVKDQMDEAGDIEREMIYFDWDEWEQYKRSGKVLHIDLVKWADVFVIAPCTANTLTKISLGLCDNLLTNCARAWSEDKRMVIAPAMNCVMFHNSATKQSFERLKTRNLVLVEPQSKKLYCGDFGVGAMANIEDIVFEVKNE